MTPAQREAYARANTSLIHLAAIEFRHPTFASEIRLVNYDVDLTLPVDSGASVLFVGAGCEIKPPDIDDQVDAVTSIQIDGVSGIVQGLLANANDSIVPIDATLRFYSFNIKTNVADGPVGVIHQQVRNVAVTKTSVAIALGYTNSANKSFPSQKYTSYSNPGLVS
jgi:Domain of unknown function (DUF1833)